MNGRRALTGMMAGALILLLAGQVLSMMQREPETATVRAWGGEEPVYVTGIVIREEIPITAPAGDWYPLLEGEEAAAGQAILSDTPPDSGPVTPARKARSPERERILLHETVAALNAASGAEKRTLSRELTALVMDGDTSAARSTERTVAAPAAGIFVTAWDGLEEYLTPENPWGEIPLPMAEPTGGAGRIILGDTWYFRTVLPEALEPGDAIDAVLPGGCAAEMTVEAVRDGETLLSCDRYLSEIAALRTMTLELPGPRISGVEIPKSALDMRETTAGVWRMAGQGTEFVPVIVMKEQEDTLVIALDQSAADGLWPGDRVLIQK